VCLSWIVLRQYLYPMLFSLIALYLFLKFKPTLKNDKKTVLLILFLSEMSFMGKEQFMTLPFVLFILSDGSFKGRIVQISPYFLLLVGHFLLRMYVLGGFGAYWSINDNPWVYFYTAINSLGHTSRVLFGNEWIIGLSLFLL